MSETRLNAAAEVVDSLFMLVRTSSHYTPDHPATRDAATRVSQGLAELTPISLQFIEGAAFADRDLLPLTLERLQRTRGLGQDLAGQGFQEIRFESVPSSETLLTLAVAWNQSGALDKNTDTAWSVRKLPVVAWGAELPAVDRPVLAATEVCLALENVEELMAAPDTAWPFLSALGALRRIDSLISQAPGAAAVVIEQGPIPWTNARLLLSISIDLGRILSVLEAPLAIRRAAIFALLCAGSRGLRGERHQPLADAAKTGLQCLLESPSSTPGPQRLRTAAQLMDLKKKTSQMQLVTSKLVATVYAMGALRLANPKTRSRTWVLDQLQQRSKGSATLRLLQRM